MLQFKLKDGLREEAVQHIQECAEISADKAVEPMLRFLALVQAAAAVAMLDDDTEYGNFLLGRAFALQTFIEKSNAN